VERLLLEAVGRESLTFLGDPNALLGALAVDGAWSALPRALLNGTALDVFAPLSDNANPAMTGSLLRWGRRATATTMATTTTTMATTTTTTDGCTPASPSRCGFRAFDINYARTEDALVWDKALANPSVRFTMLCQTQKYSAEAAQTCNPATDGRRQALGAFVDAQYRAANGVWMHTVAPGTGATWIANVASASVGFFSLLHASAIRTDTEVLSRWLVGEAPCNPPATVLQHRVCVESALRAEAPFQPLHPWMGGDFNPFEGLDECPLGSPLLLAAAVEGGGNSGTSLCPCRCSPSRYCDDPSGLHNYSAAAMEAEFPSLPNCINQAIPRFRVMDTHDQSNLCSIARSANVVAQTARQQQQQGAAITTAGCAHRQGLLGHHDSASAPRTITFEELHGAGGVTTPTGALLVQELLGGQEESAAGTPSAEGNGLWAGRTLLQERPPGSSAQFAFLRMPRHRLHPAHIAVAHAVDSTGAPLVVARVSLLHTRSDASPPSAQWPLTLGAEWRTDAALLARLYPQLLQQRPPPTTAEEEGDWSCPLRAAAFWGGRQSERFAPMVPSPVLAHALYGLGGAHPLLRARSAFPFLRAYRTTNGACFYEEHPTGGQSLLRQIPIADAANQCGLRGMLRLLESGESALSRVVDRFTDRCNGIIDTPDLGGPLRSGESLPSTLPDTTTTCGVLHRLSPFLMRTRGDAGTVAARTLAPRTTRDEGGDCHMGRALLSPAPLSDRGEWAGAECALLEKNRTHAVAGCPFSGERLLMGRARPLTLDALLAKNTFYYRDQLLLANAAAGSGAVPRFFGPGTFITLLTYATTTAAAAAAATDAKNDTHHRRGAFGGARVQLWAALRDVPPPHPGDGSAGAAGRRGGGVPGVHRPAPVAIVARSGLCGGIRGLGGPPAAAQLHRRRHGGSSSSSCTPPHHHGQHQSLGADGREPLGRYKRTKRRLGLDLCSRA
jgi:hypothetical protein